MTWSAYFPFQPGERARTEARLGPLGTIRAELRVVEVGEVLALDFHIPRQFVLLKRVPESRGLLRLVYRCEGEGNEAVLESPAKPSQVVPMSVVSDPDVGRRRLRFQDEAGHKSYGFTLARRSNGEASLRDLEGLPSLLRGIEVLILR